MKSSSTQFIILRKTKYGESSLIISTLSHDHGKLDFIVQGASKVGSKRFPVVDLFREIKGSFRLKENGLSKLTTTELLTNFDGVVSHADNYMSACSIAQFITINSHPLIPMPLLYAALKNALVQLSVSATAIPWLTLIKLVFLYEQGLLPEVLGGDIDRENEMQKQKLIERLLQFACGRGQIEIDCEYWKLFTPWINSLCDYNGIKKADGYL